jgi:hypothetical protein
MRLIITFCFSFLINFSSFSQTGKIEGKVTDSKTGTALSGVSVTAAGNLK